MRRPFPKFVVCVAINLVIASSALAEVALYQVSFDASWSSTSHPTAYPVGAHFSSLVGGTHTAAVSFRQLGGNASNGIENMAEKGATSSLLSEISAAITAGTAFSTITGVGIDSPGSEVRTFAVHEDFPLVSLVSMIAPSPDWFVGVSALPLRSGGVWLDEIVIGLEPYDAGTDSGIDFSSSNQDTQPQDPIAGFSGAPFAGTPDLGTFTFQFIAVVGPCEDTLDNDGDGLIDPGCESSDDPSEYRTNECDDGIDNDMDGDIDYPNDSDCGGPLGESESTQISPVPRLTGVGVWSLVLGFFAVLYRLFPILAQKGRDTNTQY